MLKIEKVTRLRINYKSGISETFEVSEFTIKNNGVHWVQVGEKTALVMNYFENVESVWKLSTRKVLVWK